MKRTGKILSFGIIGFSMMIILQGYQVIFSPFIFVKVINLVGIIVFSGASGAFIRELFIIKKDDGYAKE